MALHKIEGNLNFYDELYKSLAYCDDNETNTCLITGLPLKDKYVTLKCTHTFNYDVLYKELCIQKYGFNIHTLPTDEQLTIVKSGVDFSIKCPYCRNIQFTILPYYPELGFDKIYGLNSLDKTLSNAYSNTVCNKVTYAYTKYGITFKYGICCHININTNEGCNIKYVSSIPNSNFSYCGTHYFSELKKYKAVRHKQ